MVSVVQYAGSYSMILYVSPLKCMLLKGRTDLLNVSVVHTLTY